jgi:hypothetical protein
MSAQVPDRSLTFITIHSFVCSFKKKKKYSHVLQYTTSAKAARTIKMEVNAPFQLASVVSITQGTEEQIYDRE